MLCLVAIRDLAYRFVPMIAADHRLANSGPQSWWPAHEIGHFLVATPAECNEEQFGIGMYAAGEKFSYVITKELAAISISQRLLRRSGHAALAAEEIQCTDEDTLACSFERWCKRSVKKLLRANNALRLPTTRKGLEALLARKACAVGKTRWRRVLREP